MKPNLPDRSTHPPVLVAMDLEGCLVPEIWIQFSQKTGITDLSITTREVKRYDDLMQRRLEILKKNHIRLEDIQNVIETLEPLPGAKDFLDWLRSKVPLVILSDTFYEFAFPLIKKLGYPTLFCHNLDISNGYIQNYRLRTKDSKTQAVIAFQTNGFTVMAVGDSYNDIGMLQKADTGFFLHAPESISTEFPQFVSCENYVTLRKKLQMYLK